MKLGALGRRLLLQRLLTGGGELEFLRGRLIRQGGHLRHMAGGERGGEARRAT